MKAELERRSLPPLKSREEMAEIMQKCVYGYLPKITFSQSATEPVFVERRYACGTVSHSFTELTIAAGERSHTFRVDRLLHSDEKKRPLVIYINFHPMGAYQYFPIEEMSEYDADFLVFCYKDVTSDNGDFENGIAPLLRSSVSPCGKIAMWAWAAQRVLDYGLTLPGTDAANIAVAGHSRLGKTALFCAMTDKRFKFVLSNASGCLGASLAHGNTGLDLKAERPNRGETYRDIIRNFPYWFSPSFAEYADKMLSEEFDQHYLLAAIAPRFVLVGSCSLDAWADPRSEQLCCAAASPAWEKEGTDGFVCDKIAAPGEALLDGRIGYYMIESKHFMSRHGWRRYMEFIEKHRNDKLE